MEGLVAGECVAGLSKSSVSASLYPPCGERFVAGKLGGGFRLRLYPPYGKTLIVEEPQGRVVEEPQGRIVEEP